MIPPHDRVRIAAIIVSHPRTGERVYRGGGSEYSRRRVAEAARALNLPEPPERSPSNSPEPSPTSSKAA
jgi:hypothetical protein